MPSEPRGFVGGDSSSRDAVEALITGIIDDATASADKYCMGLDHANSFGVTMTAADQFAAAVIDRYADDWPTVQKMVMQHCINVLRQLVEFRWEEE
jgi:hypothetical protein